MRKCPGQVAHLVGMLSHTLKKVVGFLVGQGTYLGCRFDPQLGCVWEEIDQCFSHMDAFLSLTQINKHILGWGFKKNY